jgi:hypothetical protein
MSFQSTLPKEALLIVHSMAGIAYVRVLQFSHRSHLLNSQYSIFSRRNYILDRHYQQKLTNNGTTSQYSFISNWTPTTILLEEKKKL